MKKADHFDVNDIGDWIVDFFRSQPSLTTKPEIGRKQMQSIYESVKLFQENAPWRLIDNTFHMRIGVRISY